MDNMGRSIAKLLLDYLRSIPLLPSIAAFIFVMSAVTVILVAVWPQPDAGDTTHIRLDLYIHPTSEEPQQEQNQPDPHQPHPTPPPSTDGQFSPEAELGDTAARNHERNRHRAPAHPHRAEQTFRETIHRYSTQPTPFHEADISRQFHYPLPHPRSSVDDYDDTPFASSSEDQLHPSRPGDEQIYRHTRHPPSSHPPQTSRRHPGSIRQRSHGEQPAPHHRRRYNRGDE